MSFRAKRGICRSLLLSCCCAAPLALASALPQQAKAVADKYPDWFIRMPVLAGVQMAVGYAPLTGDTVASIQEALDCGKNALRAARAVRVRAEYLQEVLPDGNVAYRGEHYAEDTLTTETDSAVAIDTVLLRRMVLLLVASRDAPVVRSRRASLSSKAPAWVTATPAARDGTYAVGAAEAHYNEHEAWMEAERQARRSLAFGTATKLQSAMESRTGGTSNGALIATTAAELRDVVVRERWRDSRQLFVLVHARTVTVSGGGS